MRSGAMVYCDDAQNDARIHPKLVELLGFNSMTVFPLRVQERVVGVLEIFGEKAGQFGNEEISVLGKIAELVLDIYEPPAVTIKIEDAPTQPGPEPSTPKPVETIQSKISEAVATKFIETAPKLEVVKPKVVESAVEPQNEGVPAAPVPRPVVKKSPYRSSVCDVCGHQNSPDARDCEGCDVPLPVAIEVEAKAVKRKPIAFEIPERDDRWERLVSALWRPLLFLIVLITAFMLIRSHWSQLRGISGRFRNQHPISSTAASTAIAPR